MRLKVFALFKTHNKVRFYLLGNFECAYVDITGQYDLYVQSKALLY